MFFSEKFSSITLNNFFFSLCIISEIMIYLTTDVHIYWGSVVFFSKIYTQIGGHLTISSTLKLKNMLCIFFRIFSIKVMASQKSYFLIASGDVTKKINTCKNV